MSRLFFFLAFTVSGICTCLPTYALPPANGFYRELYANGKIKEQGHFDNGKKNKRWFYYNEKGNITLKEKWKNGQLIWQIFYQNGKVTHTIDKEGKITEKPKCGC